MQLDKFYEQCRDKYGWDDGDNEPAGVYQARDALVRLINKHLPPECMVEAYGYDRPGTHNGSLILYRTKGSTGQFGPEVQDLPQPEEVDQILCDAEESEELIITLECLVIEAEPPKPQKSKKRARPGRTNLPLR